MSQMMKDEQVTRTKMLRTPSPTKQMAQILYSTCLLLQRELIRVKKL